MRDSTYYLRGPWTETYWTRSGYSRDSSGDAERVSSSFKFTGFGPKDPRRRRLPNSGTYDKLYLTSVYGTSSSHAYRTLGGRWEWSRVTSGWLSGHSSWFGNVASYDIPASLVYNECLSKLNDLIRDSKTNLLLSLGEGRETARMLRSVVGLIAEARKARRLALRTPSLLMSKAWLSYKYGWQPLLADVYNYARFCASKLDAFDVKARRRIACPMPRVTTSTTRVSYSGQRFVQVELGARLSVSDRTAFDASRLSSFNPFSLAWELLPLSFVVDWLVDLSGYLTNMEASFNRGLRFDHGYRTTLWFTDMTASIDYRYTSPNTWGETRYDSMTGSSACRHVKKERVVLSDFPRPDLPTFSVNLGAQRIMSAAALIRTILLSKVG